MGRLIKHSILITLALISLQGHADSSDQTRALELSQSGEILSLEQILENSRQHIQGRVLEVELEQENNSIVYELEILDEYGQVWELKIDARTGNLIKQEQE